MPETPNKSRVQSGGDLILQEIWRIKDELSAARGHDVHRLFAEARERQKHCGHPVVNFEKEKTAKTARKQGGKGRPVQQGKTLGKPA
jgi:hypothetical protein